MRKKWFLLRCQVCGRHILRRVKITVTGVTVDNRNFLCHRHRKIRGRLAQR